MDRENGAASVDAAEVGLALAFPGRLRSYIEGLAGEAAPVERAVAAAWAGMDSLRVVTAELNGSVARPRVIGLSPARQALEVGAGEADWRGTSGSGESESAAGDDRQVSAVLEVDASRSERAARAPQSVGDEGVVGGAGLEGSVVPVIVRVAQGVQAPDAGGWTSGMRDDDVAVAPSTVKSSGDVAGSDDVEGPQRALAPVKVRIERGVASEGAHASGGSTSLPDGATEAISTAIAPVGVRGRADRAGMRADVASALRSREMVRGAVGDDGVSSNAPGPQAQRRSVTGRAMAGIQSAGKGGGEALSGEVMAPPPTGRSGDGGGGDLVLGTIMLDGHAVGTWMGSRMARDAARPGAGTTSFDPRQAPAWTPSGAL